MPAQDQAKLLEEQINQWRSYLSRRQAIQSVDVAELEDHLREQVAGLVAAGLATDEAFLVAVKRMGDLNALSREFALEHSERLWKQLVQVPSEPGDPPARVPRDAIMAIGFGIAAGVAIKAPALFGMAMTDANEEFYMRNAFLLVLPVLTAYFAWKRKLDMRTLPWLALAFVAGAIAVNVPTFVRNSDIETLTMMHLPIALWLAVGIAYAGGRWSQAEGRMDFIRFSGELFIYYVLIAAGGGVLTGILLLLFKSIGISAELFVQTWWIPCGAAGAVVIAAWLVEAKQSVIENMAPVLTRIFTPLFAAVLVAFLGTMLFTGRGIGNDRDMLIGFDLLLVLILGLLLYAISARDPRAPAGPFDVMQVVLVVSALLADAVALWAIATRISEFGFTPNRVAALGMNVILLVNLAWSAAVYVRFLRGRGPVATLERWQTNYLPVYSAWAAVVVVVFPLVFGYM
jgi:hypothetical protein